MSKQPLTPVQEEMVLVLTNERKFHDRAIELLKKYKRGDWGWNTLVPKLSSYCSYCSDKNLIREFIVERDMDNGKYYYHYIDSFVQALFEHYSEEVYGIQITTPQPPQYSIDEAVSDFVCNTRELAEAADNVLSTQKTKEKQPMKTPAKVEEKTFVNGTDAATMSDDDLFGLIADHEKEIAKLEAIKNQPKKLKERIAKINESIATLVKVVDERK